MMRCSRSSGARCATWSIWCRNAWRLWPTAALSLSKAADGPRRARYAIVTVTAFMRRAASASPFSGMNLQQKPRRGWGADMPGQRAGRRNRHRHSGPIHVTVEGDQLSDKASTAAPARLSARSSSIGGSAPPRAGRQREGSAAMPAPARAQAAAPRRRRRPRSAPPRPDAVAPGPQVGGNHGRDLGIAASGLPIRHHDDRLAAAGHLNGAGHDAVGDDVVALCMSIGRPGQAVAHAVGLARDRVGGGQKRFDPFGAEKIVLRTEDDANGRVGVRAGATPTPVQARAAAPSAARECGRRAGTAGRENRRFPRADGARGCRAAAAGQSRPPPPGRRRHRPARVRSSTPDRA